MKNKKKIMGNVLKVVASMACESTSLFGLYQPQLSIHQIKEIKATKNCHKGKSRV